MLIAFVAVIIGLILLVYSADRFVTAACNMAYELGISPLVVGLTVVAFGTSAPEIFVSATAALQDNPGLAIGNAIGSNIANVGLVLGITALFSPIFVDRGVIWQEIPIMFGAMIFTLVLLIDGTLSRLDGIGLFLGLIVFIILAIYNARKESRILNSIEPETDKSNSRNNLIWLLVSLLLLIASSKILVWGAVDVAQRLGVSDLIIGLTIVAIGTSLPEVAASIASALKKETGLAVGNVVGSNIFNLLAVVGIAGVISPTNLDRLLLYRDIPVMFIITLLMFLLIKPWARNIYLSRFGGTVLLCSYFAYLGYLITHTMG